MRFLSTILVVLILASCAKNKSVVGLYGKCETGVWACTQIELNSDSTFTLVSYSDVGMDWLSYGEWIQRGEDSIMLIPPKDSQPLFTAKTNPDLAGKLKVTVLYKGDQDNPPSGFAGVMVIINEPTIGKVTDENGVVVFDEPKTKKIICRYIGTFEEAFDIENSEINDVEIIVRDMFIRRHYNTTLAISKEGLEFTEELTLEKVRRFHKWWK